MSGDLFKGFDSKNKLIPVPSVLLSSLLVEIDDFAELRCTLRLFWLLYQAKGFPKKIRFEHLCNDDVLLKCLGTPEAIKEGFKKAINRGTVLETDGWYRVNNGQIDENETRFQLDQLAVHELQHDRPNIFSLYEENIGLITPIIAEELQYAEKEFPPSWIQSAIEEAAKNNVRNWRYIMAVLDSWKTKGKGGFRGEPGRHTEKITAAEYIQRRRNS
jgi:DnaD/phage-associated family protein